MTKLKLKRLIERPSTEAEKRRNLGCFMVPVRQLLKMSTDASKPHTSSKVDSQNKNEETQEDNVVSPDSNHSCIREISTPSRFKAL